MNAKHFLERRSVRWITPPQMAETDHLVVFCACDAEYIGYALSLIKSLDCFSPGYLFVLHVVNPGDADLLRIDDFARRLATTRLAVMSEQLDFSFASDEARRTYFACARFMVLPDLLDALSLPVFCLDADSLFVNPIDHDFSTCADAEVILFSEQLEADVPLKRRIKNGAILFRVNPAVRALLVDVRNRFAECFADERATWYLDQEVFSSILFRRRHELVIGHIRKAYLDWEFGSSSIVWTAKGDRKGDARFLFMKDMLSDRRPEHFVSLSGGSMYSPRSPWAHAKVAIFQPRFDLPWKTIDESSVIPKLKDDVVDLRLRWKEFSIHLANALERRGVRTAIHELPAAEIQPALIDRMGYELAFVPHRCHLDFKAGGTKVLFYMQEYFRWVFVVDGEGWSAASSIYPIDAGALPVQQQAGGFDEYRARLKAGKLQSKFGQHKRVSSLQLRTSREVPLGGYVFFPLQIPHDQSIRYFSDFAETEVVEAVLEWSRRSGVPVVFKPHPVSQKLMKPFAEMVAAAGGFWSTAHVHDLIANSTAVFTINSGVGFEALLHVKPVLTFGRAEYDCVTVHATPDTLDEAWAACTGIQAGELERRYRGFVDWFLGEHSIDLSRPEVALGRFDAIAESVTEALSE
ncbi:hypothetical protein [Methyloversatilis sp. XJ19-49]|uniref:capsular polysaccharide export protein, LipB/KpsS family n=1 Tax=Methyloversatilis sp. XJ19-49 TaxID=2963429 RepID=UPI00211B9307|nr:hypothetical protein [Methyloversatilis sp. XJ19-49]MCQ9378573.1 hypothetical protein [Methyloversatilis sp. XJ19-49]